MVVIFANFFTNFQTFGYVVAIIVTNMWHKSTGNVVTNILVHYKSFHINSYLRK